MPQILATNAIGIEEQHQIFSALLHELGYIYYFNFVTGRLVVVALLLDFVRVLHREVNFF